MYLNEVNGEFTFRPTSSGQAARLTYSPSPTNWILVCNQYDEATRRMQLTITPEGGSATRSIATSNLIGNNPSDTIPDIGRRKDGDSARYFGGKIGHITVTDNSTYLSNAQLESLASSFLDYDPTTEFTPALDFPFNEGAGTTVTDTVKGLVLTGTGFTGSEWTLEGTSGGGGITLSVTETLNSFNDSSTIDVSENVSISVTAVVGSFVDSSNVTVTAAITIEASVTELLQSFTDSSTINVTEAGSIDVSVTEVLNSFVDSSALNVSANIEVAITEVLNSFLDGSSVTIAKDITIQVTEVFASFTDNSFVRMPTGWADKDPVTTVYINKTPVSTDYTNKPIVNTIWTDKG